MATAAGLIRVQNLVLLCKQLRLRVSYKVHAVTQPEPGPEDDGVREVAVVVHVLNDASFKKYLNNYTLSDLVLFRGLLLKVNHQVDIRRKPPAAADLQLQPSVA
jgi:hypothetical protein